jgi:DNA replication protein DnaC
MSAVTHSLEVSTIHEQCKPLRLPTIAAICEQTADVATRENHTHLRFLNALLEAELEERGVKSVARRLQEAHLPRVKTLDEFDFTKAAKVSASQIFTLASGGYLDRKEPVLFLGDCGTGKTHLATGLCVAACRQGRKARFTTAAGLVNELLEAQQQNELARALLRYARYDVVCIDELGYVPLAELGAELLFQVISERAEKASVMITTNLPFSEWTKVFTNARLCKAILDRLTDRAHIIQTGPDSYRFWRTMEKHGGGTKASEASRDASPAHDTPGSAAGEDKAEASLNASETLDKPGSAAGEGKAKASCYASERPDKPGSTAGEIKAEASRDASGGKR